MHKNFKFKAFTLAETLLSLLIISVVAGMTIPALKIHADEQKYVNLTKKALQEATNATAKVELLHGDVMFLDPKKVDGYYEKVFDKVPTTMSLTWKTNSLDPNRDPINTIFNWITADGFAWEVYYESDDGRPVMTVDVNADSPPNILGIDQQRFIVDHGGVVPYIPCTKYVIKHSKMPWLQTPMANCPSI